MLSWLHVSKDYLGRFAVRVEENSWVNLVDLMPENSPKAKM